MTSAYGDTYRLLLPRLVSLRTALADDALTGRPLGEVRRDHQALDRCLADAVANAFAADAVDEPSPDGTRSWVAEGLARSLERELALFDASGSCGVLQPAVAMPAPQFFAPSPSGRDGEKGEKEQTCP